MEENCDSLLATRYFHGYMATKYYTSLAEMSCSLTYNNPVIFINPQQADICKKLLISVNDECFTH
uniref:Uncharacterized protein n=1 Tax=Arion vulgaris TaxID=1028688 RepID=A0A0B7AAF3_9EUPU